MVAIRNWSSSTASLSVDPERPRGMGNFEALFRASKLPIPQAMRAAGQIHSAEIPLCQAFSMLKAIASANLSAPDARASSRSNPSATPAQSGNPLLSAARKFSSSGG